MSKGLAQRTSISNILDSVFNLQSLLPMPAHLLCCLLAVALAACRNDAPDTPPMSGRADTVSTLPAPDSAEVLTDTVYVEGQAVPVALESFDEPGVPFTTAFPEGDFLTETISVSEGTAVRFDANFGGVPNRAAAVTFFFTGEGAFADAAALDSTLRGIIADKNWQLREDARPGELESPCPWAQVQHTFVSRDGLEANSGYACVGMHGGKPFYLLVHIPVEYADGFGPRLRVLLDHFRWRDTGAPLAPSGAYL